MVTKPAITTEKDDEKKELIRIADDAISRVGEPKETDRWEKREREVTYNASSNGHYYVTAQQELFKSKDTTNIDL